MSLQRIGQSAAPYILCFCANLFVALSVAWSPLATETHAQDSAEMSAVYGRGVHAYFSNRMSGAEQLFSQVIQAGSTDPRVYYFRAMARLRTGRQYEAEEDMKVGAAYEARDPGSQHSIGIALQRVQGQGRRSLERFRREGRLNRVQQHRQQSQLRYEQLEQRGPQVLRRETPVQLEQLSKPSMLQTIPAVPTPAETGPAPTEAGLPAPVAAPIAEEDDLFFDSAPKPEMAPGTPVDPSPAPEASDSADDFFDDPAPSKPAEADEDPFADTAEIGDTPESNTDPPMAEEAAASEEEASQPTAEDDFFGDLAAEEGNAEEGNVEEESIEEMPAEESDDSESEPEASESEEAEPAEEPSDSEEPSESTEEESDPSEADDLFGDF
ncbi:MAG: hypothetical protein GXP28_05400 [Planctomycetes bacterium]|nr:hypothetical protein [Planctomycetota bacterium]